MRTPSKNNPIIPIPWTGAVPEMTLRDWFAGQALASNRFNSYSPDVVVEYAYEFADAKIGRAHV